MITVEIHDDIFKHFEAKKYDAFAHGCNCYHIMGGGIAHFVSTKYPQALEADKKTIKGDKSKLGQFSVAKSEFGDIINMYTQFITGRDLHIDKLRQCFENLNKTYKGKVVAIPKIGCGIAGGDWDTVKNIINEVTPDVEIDVYYV